MQMGGSKKGEKEGGLEGRGLDVKTFVCKPPIFQQMGSELFFGQTLNGGLFIEVLEHQMPCCIPYDVSPATEALNRLMEPTRLVSPIAIMVAELYVPDHKYNPHAAFGQGCSRHRQVMDTCSKPH